MRSHAWRVAVIAVPLAIWTSGCKSLDEYKQLEMAHRTLEGEKAQLESELYDARSNNDNLRTKLEACDAKLQDRETLVASLQGETNRLQEAFKKCQSTLETLAGKQVPGEPLVVERVLPPALDSALKEFAAKYPDAVQYDPKRGIVKWKSDLVFALGSDAVVDSAHEALRSFAQIMTSAAATGFDVLVVGHTDNVRIAREETRRQHPTNWHLSAHRAIAVSNALQEAGVQPTRVGVMGFGEFRPIQPNTTEDGRAQNRRVEIFVVPAGSVGGVATTLVPAPAAAAPHEGRPAPATDADTK